MAGQTDQSTIPPSSSTNTNNSANVSENLHGRHESLIVASANITLTMLRRGELLEADLARALDHVRDSNNYLKKFVDLLETIDGDRWNEREHIDSWLDIAKRARTVRDKEGDSLQEDSAGNAVSGSNASQTSNVKDQEPPTAD